MRRREIIWIAVLATVGFAYYHFFAGSGKKQMIILASWHPNFRLGPGKYSMYFTLNDDFKLTSLKVVPLQDDGQVSQGTPPVWSLTSVSNSVPTRAFQYGQHIKGMKPALANVKPEPLEAGVPYRITLTAGELTASKDFTAKAME
jgi:hypothetical protein